MWRGFYARTTSFIKLLNFNEFPYFYVLKEQKWMFLGLIGRRFDDKISKFKENLTTQKEV